MTDTSLEQRLVALKAPLSHDQMAERVRRWGWWSWTEHYLRQVKSYAGSIIGVGTLEPLLFLLAMGVGLGVVVDAATDTEAVLGTSYLLFIGPALLLSTMITVGMIENTYSIMGGFRWQRVYYGPQVTAITPGQIAFGHLVGSNFRYLMTGVLFLTVLYLFGAVQGWAGLALLPLGLLAANSFGLPMMAFASYITKDSGQFALVNRFLVLPMTLFSGTFFPLETLPSALHPIGWVSPLWHAVNLGRAILTGTPIAGWLVAVHLIYLVVLGVIGWFIARANFERRLVG